MGMRPSDGKRFIFIALSGWSECIFGITCLLSLFGCFDRDIAAADTYYAKNLGLLNTVLRSPMVLSKYDYWNQTYWYLYVKETPMKGIVNFRVLVVFFNSIYFVQDKITNMKSASGGFTICTQATSSLLERSRQHRKNSTKTCQKWENRIVFELLSTRTRSPCSTATRPVLMPDTMSLSSHSLMR